jgi:hypothetical protein
MMGVPSVLGYTNRLEYFINTKLSTKIPDDLKHDIACALYDYGEDRAKEAHKQMEYWRDYALAKVREVDFLKKEIKLTRH